MKRFGTQRVKAGYYVSPTRRKIEMIGREGGVLPGDVGIRYLRIPLPLLMIASPIMGAVYVVLLPVIGIFAVLWIALESAGVAARSAWTNRAPSLHDNGR